jgi:hypothetical protein
VNGYYAKSDPLGSDVAARDRVSLVGYRVNDVISNGRNFELERLSRGLHWSDIGGQNGVGNGPYTTMAYLPLTIANCFQSAISDPYNNSSNLAPANSNASAPQWDLIGDQIIRFEFSATAMDSLYGRKGLLSFADLTQIGLTQSDIDHLVGWRNYATAKPEKDWGSYSFPLESASNYYNFVLSNTTGFLTVPNDETKYPPFNGNTDHLFQSRQQLIQFRRGVNGPGVAGFSQDALQYLGTFSREKNAPSWWPQTPVTSGSDYAANADKPDSANRNIINVRFQSDATLTRYRLDATAYTKTVKAGDPVVCTRFPLGRLAWLASNGPAPGIPSEAIKTHFGLVWDPANLYWNYTSPTGTGSPASEIKKLEQVKQEGREPDFFELLRAGILEGSLGKTAADPTKAPNPSDTCWERKPVKTMSISTCRSFR